ncbi:hypothetical protein WJX77_008325 [Trebouxia sp. C0004]
MVDIGNHRWIEKFAQHQEPVSQIDMTWLTSKLTLPTAMHAKWRLEEHTALSAGYACLDLALPCNLQLDGLQLQSLISSCLGRDKSDLYVPVLTISLNGCKVDHAAIWRLAAEIMALGSHCMLRNLELSSCSLPSDALGWLAYLRPATEQLQRLDISDNPLLRLNSCKQLLETSMLFEDAPLRLLSIHHTGMTNEDLCLLFSQLTADPEEISTQAYLKCLKLGPAVLWTSASDQQASQAVLFKSETLQHMIDMLKGLPELEVLQVWGLDAEQQARLADAWSSVKAHPGHITTTADSFRICTSPSDAEHAVEHWPKHCKLPTQPTPAGTPSLLPSPERGEQPMSRGSGGEAAGGHHSQPSPADTAPRPDPHGLEVDDDFQLLPPRHTVQHHALPIQRSRPQNVAAGSARMAQHATAKPRHRSGHTHRHRQSWKPPHDTGENAVSRLYANLGLGYDAPNSVDDAEFADNPRRDKPVGYDRLQPSAHAAGDDVRHHRHPGHRQQSNGAWHRARAVAPEYGGGREYDVEAEFMNELGPLPKPRPDDGDGGTVRRPKQRRQAALRHDHIADDAAAAMDFEAYQDAANQPMDWQTEPDMLDSHRQHSISPRGQHDHLSHILSPSPTRHHSSPGTDLESDGPAHQSPQVPADQPAGVDSDDNFEVSDGADERQLRRGRWDAEDDVGSGGDSSGSEAATAPAVRPTNMSKREWELLQEARELEQGAFAFDKNRSKYQPRGHFDAAVGGRRRQQKAGAGSALEKLRQRRLQQAALTGAGAVASDANVPVSVSAKAKRSEAPDLRTSNRSGKHRRHFVDSQAAGGDSSKSDRDSDSSSPNEPTQHHQQDPQHSRGQAAANMAIQITDDGSSSSEDDMPLAAKRHRSRSLPRQSQSSDSDSFSSPSKQADNETRSTSPISHSTAVGPKQRVQKQRTGVAKSGKLPEAERSSRMKRAREHSQAVSQHTNTQPDAPTPNAAMASLPPPHSRAPRASSLGKGSSPREGEAAEVEDGEVGNAGVPAEEQAAAFEVPSQMPRELQSWAWDKRAEQHPPNLQKIYPAQAKRVRRAPDRYSVEEAPSLHRSASEEQRRLADQLHRSHPPGTHSGKKRKSRQSTPGAVVTPVQAAQESSSDDEDDDTPLAMLPASALAAKRATVSFGHQPSETPPSRVDAAASDSAKPPASPHVHVEPDSSVSVENNSGRLAEPAARQGSGKHDTAHAMPSEEALGMPIHTSSAVDVVGSAPGLEGAESVCQSAVSLGHDQEPSTAAGEAVTDELQGALPDQKASTSLCMRPSPSSAHHAQQQSGSRQQATADAVTEDTLPAAKAADLISDSESEGQAGAASEGRSDPQRAATSMQTSPPSAINSAGTKPSLASHVDDKPGQHVRLSNDQQPQAEPAHTAMPRLQASSELAPQMTVSPSPPSTLHGPTQATGGQLPGNTQWHDMTGSLLSSTCELLGTARSPLHDSSESLLQAEAEAARLAQLMVPVIYRQPRQARQLAIAGQAPVKDTAGKAAGALQTEGDIAGAGEVLPEPSGHVLADMSCADKQDRYQLMAESSEAAGESAELQTETSASQVAAKHDGQQQLAMRLVDAYAMPVAAGVLDAADLIIPDSEEQEI